jgi:hypothetical protein
MDGQVSSLNTVITIGEKSLGSIFGAMRGTQGAAGTLADANSVEFNVMLSLTLSGVGAEKFELIFTIDGLKPLAFVALIMRLIRLSLG